MKSTFRSLVTAAFLAVCGLAQAETIEFKSLNAKQGFPAILEGRAQYTDKINGVFTRPDNVKGDVPVMVIMHGSGGNLPTGTGEWSKLFLGMGIATFVVDSFGPRGIETTVADAAQLSYAASVADSLTALQTVAKIPGVDASKIGVIGFSRGGVAATVSGHENIRAAVLGPKSDLHYALHVVLYGGCTQVGTTDGKPILFLMGDNDDYISVKTCNNFVDAMRSRGANIELVVYPGARHSYDVDRKETYAPKGQTWKNCAPRYMDLDNDSYSIEGKQVTSKEYGDNFGKCFSRGITVGPNYPAIEQSRARVKAFILKSFVI